MAFTGKATYTAGSDLPEIAEDVSDIIGIVSPFEAPLLDLLGDPPRSATSTIHEWLEDELIPNSDQIDDGSISNPTSDTVFTVEDGSKFRIGDQIQLDGLREIMLVTDVSGNDLTVVRGYGGTTPDVLQDDAVIQILGNAALEGDDAPTARFTNRVRKTNYTQIFTAGVEVSGSQQASQTIGLADELDYQKQERLRELIRDLENCVINGASASATPEGDASTRRTMRGIVRSLVTNTSNAVGANLTEDLLNSVLRDIWSQSSASIDTIVVNGLQKRAVNGFIASSRGFEADDVRFRDMVSVYESDFGVCRVVLSRWVPPDMVLLLDSSRIDVLPLKRRSFHFKQLARTGDRDTGQLVGEYTLEVRNENAHGLIQNLAAS